MKERKKMNVRLITFGMMILWMVLMSLFSLKETFITNILACLTTILFGISFLLFAKPLSRISAERDMGYMNFFIQDPDKRLEINKRISLTSGIIFGILIIIAGMSFMVVVIMRR